MKTKIAVIIFACILLLSFTLGAAGNLPLAQDEVIRSGNDRLIGVLITTESLDLFDFEGYLRDHPDQLLGGGEISGSDKSAYENRLYATLVNDPLSGGRPQYKFEGIDGICFFCASYTDTAGTYTGVSGDEAVSDGHTSIRSTDAGDDLSLEGTIYISTSGGPPLFYTNPVYQTASGEVYAVSGQGTSYGGSVTSGISGSHALNETQTVTVDGESKTVRSDITMTFAYKDPPTRIRIVQMDAGHNAVSSQEFAPDHLPDTLTTEPDTAYLLVETYATAPDGTETVTRELLQPEEDTLSAFSCREDGICVKQQCSLQWAA